MAAKRNMSREMSHYNTIIRDLAILGQLWTAPNFSGVIMSL